MSLAVFDLDGTLIGANSGHSWVWREFREGRIGAGQLAEAVWWFTRYALGFGDLERAFSRLGESVIGEPEEDVRARTSRWFDEVVRGQIRPRALDVLAHHRDAGDTLLLATSGTAQVAALAAAAWGLHASIGTEIALENGRFNGKLAAPAFGPHKLQRVRDWAQAQGFSLSDTYFYSDSASDLPLLEAVAHPRVINPDRVLRARATAAAWPIEDWR